MRINFPTAKHKCKWVERRASYNNTVYLSRSCECGRRQILAAGVIGDSKWHDIDTFKFVFKHEKKQFLKAMGWR